MGIILPSQLRQNADPSPRWNRTERAERFEQYRELQAQGLSQRQAAQELQIPRTTLQAWQAHHESLDEHPAIVSSSWEI